MFPEHPRFSPGAHDKKQSKRSSDSISSHILCEYSLIYHYFSSSACSIFLWCPIVKEHWVRITLQLVEYKRIICIKKTSGTGRSANFAPGTPQHVFQLWCPQALQERNIRTKDLNLPRFSLKKSLQNLTKTFWIFLFLHWFLVEQSLTVCVHVCVYVRQFLGLWLVWQNFIPYLGAVAPCSIKI